MPCSLCGALTPDDREVLQVRWINDELRRARQARYVAAKRKLARQALVALALLVVAAGTAHAQTPTVQYDYLATGITAPQLQAWTPILYVNNTAIPGIVPTCSTITGGVRCTYVSPNIGGALTPSGQQVFTLALRDPVLGEGPKSSPLALTKPAAPTNLLLSLLRWAVSGSTSSYGFVRNLIFHAR